MRGSKVEQPLKLIHSRQRDAPDPSRKKIKTGFNLTHN